MFSILVTYTMHKRPVILNTETKANSTLFSIEEVSLRFANGQERIFERIRSNRLGTGAVMVIPITHDQQVILVKEYAAGTDRYELCLPKGLIECNEPAKQAANRELQEEIGFAANKLTYLTTLSAAPNYFSAELEVFVATDLFQSTLPGDEPEVMEQIKWPLSAIPELVNREDVTEAKTIAALFLYKSFLETS